MEHVTGPCLKPKDLVPFTVEVSRDDAESCRFGRVEGDEGLDLVVVLDGIQCVVQVEDNGDMCTYMEYVGVIAKSCIMVGLVNPGIGSSQIALEPSAAMTE